MSILTRDYFTQTKWYALLGAFCGTALAALFGFGSHSAGWMLIWLLLAPFLNGPLTLRTQVGRLWWGAYGGLVACLTVIYVVRLPHPMAWVGLALCAGLGIIIVCLRWRPPITDAS